MLRLLPAATIVAVLAALAIGPSAYADGDPASDVLIYSDVFVPFSAQSSAPSTALQKAVAGATSSNKRVKVAVISSKEDLGAVPTLFEKPAAYAKFLGFELSQFYSGVLLIVMPNGFGVYHRGKATSQAETVLSEMTVDGSSIDTLIGSATQAVGKLSAARGVLAWKDTLAPQANVAPAVGHRGSQLTLRYSLFDDSGKASASVVVTAGSKSLATWNVRARPLSGQLFTVKWKAPKVRPHGKLQFCVTAKDAAGNKSKKTCAPVRLT